MTCPACLRALQVAAHRDYQEGCVSCGVRELAHMGPEKKNGPAEAEPESVQGEF